MWVRAGQAPTYATNPGTRLLSDTRNQADVPVSGALAALSEPDRSPPVPFQPT